MRSPFVLNTKDTNSHHGGAVDTARDDVPRIAAERGQRDQHRHAEAAAAPLELKSHTVLLQRVGGSFTARLRGDEGPASAHVTRRSVISRSNSTGATTTTQRL